MLDSTVVQIKGSVMTALDTVKKVVHLVNTAGLAKEVVHLVETKLSSLTEQIMAMESEYAQLKAENEKLKVQIKCLQPQSEEVSQDTVGILKLFFERAQDISADEISAVFKWKPSVVEYHIDVLLKKRFIRESTIGMQTPFGSSVSKFGLTTLGRRYVIQYIAT
jgi:Fic family protein